MNSEIVQNSSIPPNIVSSNTHKIKRIVNTDNDIVKNISEPLNVNGGEEEFFDALPNPINTDTENLTLDQNQVDLRPLFEQGNPGNIVNVGAKRNIKKPDRLNL